MSQPAFIWSDVYTESSDPSVFLVVAFMYCDKVERLKVISEKFETDVLRQDIGALASAKLGVASIEPRIDSFSTPMLEDVDAWLWANHVFVQGLTREDIVKFDLWIQGQVRDRKSPFCASRKEKKDCAKQLGELFPEAESPQR